MDAARHLSGDEFAETSIDGKRAAGLPARVRRGAARIATIAPGPESPLYCCRRFGSFLFHAVIRTLEAKGDKENPTNLLRLALALHGTNREGEARQTAEQVTTLAQQKLPTAKSPRWMRFDLAVAERLLERKDSAYQRLRELIDKGGFPDPVLGRVDPGLDLFKSDTEFKSILAELDKKNAATRARILEMER